MKGLALNAVWAMVIAIVGVLLFLMLVTGTLKNAANWFYCDIYIKVINFFTGREMASIPEVCKHFDRDTAKVERIEETSNRIFSRKLLAYIISCWKEAEIKGLYESHPCYELRLPGNVSNVSESNVTDVLIREDHCKSIENSDYGCGTEDQIIWSIEGGVINTQRIVLIEYNGPKDAVEVIG